MQRGTNYLLKDVYTQIERADFIAEMIFTISVFAVVVVVAVFL